MDKKTEALKPCEYCGHPLPQGVDKRTRQVRSKHFASCKVRLEQKALEEQAALAESEPVAWMYDQAKFGEKDLRGRQWHPVLSHLKPYTGDGMVRELTPLYKEMPSQQEPVAWMYDTTLPDGEVIKDWTSIAHPLDVTLPDEGVHNIRPLYAAPLVSKPWVGLTSSDRIEILRAEGEAAVMLLTEAKLKERNA